MQRTWLKNITTPCATDRARRNFFTSSAAKFAEPSRSPEWVSIKARNRVRLSFRSLATSSQPISMVELALEKRIGRADKIFHLLLNPLAMVHLKQQLQLLLCRGRHLLQYANCSATRRGYFGQGARADHYLNTPGCPRRVMRRVHHTG